MLLCLPSSESQAKPRTKDRAWKRGVEEAGATGSSLVLRRLPNVEWFLVNERAQTLDAHLIRPGTIPPRTDEVKSGGGTIGPE